MFVSHVHVKQVFKMHLAGFKIFTLNVCCIKIVFFVQFYCEICNFSVIKRSKHAGNRESSLGGF